MRKETLNDWNKYIMNFKNKFTTDDIQFGKIFTADNGLVYRETLKLKYIMNISDSIKEHNDLMKELIDVLKSNKDVYE